MEADGLRICLQLWLVGGAAPLEADGRFHLFAARWPEANVDPAWRKSSEIAHYVGDGPEGPFRFSDVALRGTGRETWDRYAPENPEIRYYEGKYVLLYIANPDYRQPQLFRRGRLRYTADAVHETYVLDGTLGRTTEPIAQVPFKDLAQIVHKMQRYSTLGVERLAERRTKPSMWSAFAHGLGAFLRHYVVRAGFLDGWAGFIIAFSNFEGTFYRYAKYAERMNGLTREPPVPPSLRR